MLQWLGCVGDCWSVLRSMNMTRMNGLIPLVPMNNTPELTVKRTMKRKAYILVLLAPYRSIKLAMERKWKAYVLVPSAPYLIKCKMKSKAYDLPPYRLPGQGGHSHRGSQKNSELLVTRGKLQPKVNRPWTPFHHRCMLFPGNLNLVLLQAHPQ